MRTCSNCQSELPAGAQFCPKCGAGVAASLAPETPVAARPPQAPRISARATPPPPRTGPPPKKNARGWWIVPAVVVGLVVLAWLLLAGLPFGGEEKNRIVATQRPSDVIAEGTPPPQQPAETGTILEFPGDVATTVTSAPPNVGDTTATMVFGQPATATVAPPVTGAPPPAPVPPPVVATRTTPPAQTTPPARATTPPPQTASRTPAPRPAPAPARTEPRDEPMYSNQREDRAKPAPKPSPQPSRASMPVTEGEASGRLHSRARSYYDDVSASCLEVRSQGYVNEGYTMTVWNTCDSRGGSRLLGRWRVDAKTGEIFRQNANGKYVDP